MQKRTNKTVLMCFFIIISILLSSCCTPPENITIKIRDGKEYGKPIWICPQNYWHHYERAIDYANGGFFENAIIDLKYAIKERDRDERRVEKYGVHYFDYFPHRELGIILFRQGAIKLAVNELERSYNMEKSSRTTFYLDKARMQLNEVKNDRERPNIEIKLTNKLTNKYFILIDAEATDKYYVKKIDVQNISTNYTKHIDIDVSKQKIPFKTYIPIVVGQNKIKISVSDLTGNKSIKVINVYGDYTSPIIGIETNQLQNNNTKESRLKGYIFDLSGVKELRINEKLILLGSGEQNYIEFDEIIDSRSNVLIIAKDKADNTTTLKENMYPLLAINDQQNIQVPLFNTDSSNNFEPNCPRNSLTPNIITNPKLDLQDIIYTYLDTFTLDLAICYDKKIKDTIINKISIQEGELTPTCRLTHRINLSPGMNKVHIESYSTDNKSNSKLIRIERLLAKKQVGYPKLNITVSCIFIFNTNTKDKEHKKEKYKFLVKKYFHKYWDYEDRFNFEFDFENKNVNNLTDFKIELNIKENKAEEETRNYANIIGYIKSFISKKKHTADIIGYIKSFFHHKEYTFDHYTLDDKYEPNRNIEKGLEDLIKELKEKFPHQYGKVKKFNRPKELLVSFRQQLNIKKNMKIVVFQAQKYSINKRRGCEFEFLSPYATLTSFIDSYKNDEYEWKARLVDNTYDQNNFKNNCKQLVVTR